MASVLSPTVTNIYRIRARARLTQEEFGVIFGITKGFVSKIENGTARPGADLLEKIATRFDVDPTWLTKPLDRRIRL